VEWKRKVRTLTGNYQLLKLQPSLLASTNPIRFEFISHRLLKLAIPFLLAAILLASIVLQHPVYRLALIAQLTFYGVTLLNFAPWKNSAIVRLAHSAFIFVLMNAAAAAALVNFLMGRRVAWKS
jgi:hypothetical protein